MIILTFVVLAIAFASGEEESFSKSTTVPGVNISVPDTKNVTNTTKPTGDGFMVIPGFGRYKMGNASAKWETARRTCIRQGGHLLIPNSKAETMAVLKGLAIKGPVWIGFDDYDRFGEHMTLHGTTLEEAGYSKWGNKAPNIELRCGMMTADGYLNTSHCCQKMNYICEKASSMESPEAKRRPVWLPAGYFGLGDMGYFRVHHEFAMWETARRRCRAEGSRLFVPKSAAMMAAVVVALDGYNTYWIGFDGFDGPKDVFTNFLGQKLGEKGVYSKWKPKTTLSTNKTPTPNKTQTTNDTRVDLCGLTDPNGLLDTASVYTRRKFICELLIPGEKSRFDIAPATSAPQGYKKLGVIYYKMAEKPMIWERARRACKADGATLAMFESQAEADVILKSKFVIEKDEKPKTVLLGFDDFINTGEFVWQDGLRVHDTDMKWANKEPQESLHCGCALTTGELRTCNCTTPYLFICQWHSPGNRGFPSDVLKYPKGYQRVGLRGFYKVHHDEVPWVTARRRCQAEGAHLLVLNSVEEAYEVAAVTEFTSWYWVGFDAFDEDGTFKTVLGLTLEETGYINWAPKHPAKNTSCGATKKDTHLGTVDCESHLPYVCEQIMV